MKTEALKQQALKVVEQDVEKYERAKLSLEKVGPLPCNCTSNKLCVNCTQRMHYSGILTGIINKYYYER